MAVTDGQPVNAAITNAAFLSRTQDSDTTGKIGLANTDLESGNVIANTQKLLNQILDAQGNLGEDDATNKDYSSNNVVTDGDDRKVAIGKLDAEFNPTTGHSHDGVDSAPISAGSLTGFNAYSAAYVAKDITGISGTTFDVSSDFSGDTAGGAVATEGVITSNPDNYVSIIETTTGQEIEDVTGKRVFGRLTEAAGVWTLSFFVNDAGVETAHDLQPSTDISIFYREVFGPANPRPTITADVGRFDSLNVTADIVDASDTQAGKVNTSAQSFAGQKTFTTGADINGDPVVSEAATQTLTNKTIDGASIENPTRLDVKKDTQANLETYALTASNGQKVFATDTETYFSILNGALVPEGTGGAGGSLDFFYNEDFNSIDIADILVTGTWTKALETVTPISGDQSIKLTQASGSLGAYATVASIDLEENQKDSTIAFQTRYKYDGSNVDLEFRVYDVTNSQYIGSVPLKATSSVKTAQIICNTRATTNQIEWRFVVVNENISAVLDFDNVEGRLNPLRINNLTVSESASYQQRAGEGSTATRIPYYVNQIQDNTGSLIQIENSSVNGFSITALTDCLVSVKCVAAFNNERFGISLNSTQLTTNIQSQTDPQNIKAQVNISSGEDTVTLAEYPMKAGDILRPHNGNFVNFGNNDFWSIDVTATTTSNNIIFEDESNNSLYKDYTPVFTNLGTVTDFSARYRHVGDELTLQIDFVNGTIPTAIASITLPEGFESKDNLVASGGTNDSIPVGSYFRDRTAISNGGPILINNNSSVIKFGRLAYAASSLNALDEDHTINLSLDSSDRTTLYARIPVKQVQNYTVSVPVTNEVENVYSAFIAGSAGASVSVTSQSSTWIDSVSQFSTGQFIINYAGLGLTTIPAIQATFQRAAAAATVNAEVTNVTTTSARVNLNFTSSASFFDGDFSIILQRQGADYRAPKGYFFGNLSQPVAYIKDVKPSGTDGGSATTGSYQTRDLNTLEDPNGIVTNLTSNQFTLQKGTYLFDIQVPAYRVNGFKARLRNITDAVTSIVGSNASSGNGSGDLEKSNIKGYLSIDSTKTFEVQQANFTAQSGNGLGFNQSFTGEDEIFTIVKITKVK